MKTTPYFEAGHVATSSTNHYPGATDPSRLVDSNLDRLWQYRRMLRSPLIHPFRKVLRPFIRRMFASNPDGLNFKLLTLGITLLALLLAPLVFVMLLPLVLILLPVAILFGIIGLISTSAQADADEIQHHSLTWHLMH